MKLAVVKMLTTKAKYGPAQNGIYSLCIEYPLNRQVVFCRLGASCHLGGFLYVGSKGSAETV